ncbi:MAG: ATP-binding protein [Opitutaceae bacterium]
MTERQNIEWKRSWQDEYLKWICGFANAQGGSIFIGKEDDGSVCGLANAKKLLEDIPSKAKQQLGLTLDVNLHEAGGKQFLEIPVQPSSVAISLRGRYYYRTGSTKIELTGITLNEFLLNKAGLTWDAMPEPDATLDDIEPAAVERFLKDAKTAGRMPDIGEVSTQELFEKLRLIQKGQLTRAAVVLFGKDPAKFYHSLSVKLGRFADEVDIRYQEVIEGNIIQSLPEILEQLERKFFVKAIRFEGIHRIEEPPYPTAALREVFLNALVHRRYLSSTVQARIYDDRLRIWNEGPLPHEIKDLNAPHASVPRNRLIADICFKAGYIDSWGRGIEKITNACTEYGCAAPIYEATPTGVQVTLLPKFKMTPQVTQQVTQQETQQVGTKSPTQLGPSEAQVGAHEAQVELTEIERSILTACINHPQESKVLLEVAGYAKRTGNFKRSMSKLLKHEFLELTIPDKPTSRLQKYQLTDKAKKLLKV